MITPAAHSLIASMPKVTELGTENLNPGPLDLECELAPKPASLDEAELTTSACSPGGTCEPHSTQTTSTKSSKENSPPTSLCHVTWMCDRQPVTGFLHKLAACSPCSFSRARRASIESEVVSIG